MGLFLTVYTRLFCQTRTSLVLPHLSLESYRIHSGQWRPELKKKNTPLAISQICKLCQKGYLKLELLEWSTQKAGHRARIWSGLSYVASQGFPTWECGHEKSGPYGKTSSFQMTPTVKAETLRASHCVGQNAFRVLPYFADGSWGSTQVPQRGGPLSSAPKHRGPLTPPWPWTTALIIFFGSGIVLCEASSLSSLVHVTFCY